MDPVTQRRMRTAHTNYAETCPCGRELRGNGRKTHQRACPDYLRERGWPLDAAMKDALREKYRLGATPVIRGVERKLGALVLAHRDRGERSPLPAMPWREFCDLVWAYADDTATEATETL